MKVEDLKVVGIDYTLFLDDGTIADSSEGEEPLYFIYGQGNIIPGLEKGLKDLSVGDEKTIVVPSDEAYGQFDPEAFEEIPRSAFPADFQLEIGMPFALQDEDMNHIPAMVQEIKDDVVVMNMNHPLAGQNLKFQVKVVDIREATKEELEHGHVHGPGGHHHH